MLLLPIICYFITAVSFVFPPLAPMFEPYKSSYCTFVPRIAAVPAWSHKACPEVCKSADIMVNLFYKASPVDVCLPVLEKGLSVVFPVPPPVLSVCSALVSTCKPDFTSGMFKLQVCPSPAFPFCPVPSPYYKKTAEKELTTFFLIQFVGLLILIGFANQVDCLFKKVYTLSKEVVRKLVGLPTEDEVAACLARIPELEEKVVSKKNHRGELKDAFVKIAQEATSLEDSLFKTKTLIDELSQKLKDAKMEAQMADKACLGAFESHFVTITKLKNENDSLYKKIYK